VDKFLPWLVFLGVPILVFAALYFYGETKLRAEERMRSLKKEADMKQSQAWLESHNSLHIKPKLRREDAESQPDGSGREGLK
jgi:Flp pilus assembly protein TadB